MMKYVSMNEFLHVFRDWNLESLASLGELTNGRQKLVAKNYFVNALDANLFLVFAKQV